MRQKRDWCHPYEAAERLGISVDEVLALISTGELPAVTFLDDEDRWLVERVAIDGMARKARIHDARSNRRVGRKAGFWQLLWRCLDAIF